MEGEVELPISNQPKKTTMQLFKTIFWVVAVIVVFVLFFKWSSGVDAQREAQYAAYEKCVMEEYGTTPSAWYAAHGETPRCETTSDNQTK